MKSIVTFLFLLITLCSFSQKSFLGVHPLSDTIPHRKPGFFFLPLIYYTPDTRWAAGGAGVYYFHAGSQSEHEGEDEARLSYIQFLADYTQNQQLDVWSVWDIFTREEKYLFEGELRFRNFPDRFYGIGNLTDEENVEKYEYSYIALQSLMMKKVKKNIFAGIDYTFEYEFGFKHQPGGLLERGVISGYDGGLGSAIGLVALLDSRDNVINTYEGTYAGISTYFFTRALGSTFKFTNINGDFKQYWQIKRKHILAYQAKLRFTFGEVPFLDMSTLGDDDMLRGYPKNRYRDKNFMGTQIEYRFPIWWRFGGVAFSGVGDVFDQPNDLHLNSLKYSVGAGMRFIINPAERLNLRIDYGYGKEGGHIYFLVRESF